MSKTNVTSCDAYTTYSTELFLVGVRVFHKLDKKKLLR